MQNAGLEASQFFPLPDLSYLLWLLVWVIQETMLILAFAFAAFHIAETATLSGIMAILFYGIFMAHYGFHSLTEKSKVSSIAISKILGFLAEGFVYARKCLCIIVKRQWYMNKTELPVPSIHFKTLICFRIMIVAAVIGFSVFGVKDHDFDAVFTLMVLFYCLVGRAFNTFPLSAVTNLGRKRKIDYRTQIVIWFAGLRGAIGTLKLYHSFSFFCVL